MSYSLYDICSSILSLASWMPHIKWSVKLALWQGPCLVSAFDFNYTNVFCEGSVFRMKETKRMRLVEGSDQDSGFEKLGWENLPYTAIHAIAKLDLKISNSWACIIPRVLSRVHLRHFYDSKKEKKNRYF